jgi:O-antigen/teichoic acid export membrane protein
LRARLLNGSVTMLVSSGIVGVTNLAYNLILARRLGAEDFGHASVIYTMLMLTSSVTLAFQLVASKLIAKNPSPAARASIYHHLHRRAWQAALVIGGLIVTTSPLITYYLNLPRQIYVILLGVGATFYIPLGVRRGLMQGSFAFRRLAINSLLEVMVKLGGALLLLRAGRGVTGVIAAVAASVAAAYLTAGPPRELVLASRQKTSVSFEEGVQAVVFFVGQAAINNLDIVLVKHFFPAAVAGLYAAVALVGRAVYILCWSVVSGMFPVSAGSPDAQGRRSVLHTALLMVVLLSSLFTLALWMMPESLWITMLGAPFLAQAHASFSALLALYSALTGVFCVSVVLMTYEMSHRIANTGWLQLAFSAAIAIGIYRFHSSLYSVIGVQLVLMLLFLLAVATPFLLLRRHHMDWDTLGEIQPLLKLRAVKEDEVIAEFLKAEFFQTEFDAFRPRLSGQVFAPDLDDRRDNAIRRNLLFHRRGRMWCELPRDIQWWEVELRESDIFRIRLFPRKHWRILADGSFYLADMIESIRARLQTRKESVFSAKIQSVLADLRRYAVPDSVLLIGTDETAPLTIIEGNHRMMAAMLDSPHTVHSRFRFYCGLSPRMRQCCWYATNAGSLSRYLWNTAKYTFGRRNPDLTASETPVVSAADVPEIEAP